MASSYPEGQLAWEANIVTALLDSLRPTRRGRPPNIKDLVELAGVDVSAWQFRDDGRAVKYPSRNGAFCYEWAFRQPGKVAVLLFWHERLVDAGGAIQYRVNLRKLIAEHRGRTDLDPGQIASMVRRASAMETAIRESLENGATFRVVIVDGPRRRAEDPADVKSEVKARMLDTSEWHCAGFDGMTGEYLFARGPASIVEEGHVAIEPHPLYEDDGRLVKARFLVVFDEGLVNVVLESRGGTIGSANERNSEYGLALRLIVSRLASAGIGIQDATVESSELIRRGLTKVQRRVLGLSFPILLSKTTDTDAIAIALQRGQKTVGSESATGGGNTTRRVLLSLVDHHLGPDALADLLGAGSHCGEVPLPLGPDIGGQIDEDFNPTGLSDARRRVFASLAQRQGQPAFRRELLEAYDHKCAITGCDLSAALEAAHIVPYWGPHTNHVQNGLLLRSDLHTLFDRGVFGIDPATWQVKSNGSLKGTHYEWLDEQTVTLPKLAALKPSEKALRLHLQTLVPVGVKT